MIIIKTPAEIALMKQGGKILADILDQVAKTVKPGVTTQQLDELAEDLILKAGGRPAFKNYQVFGDEPPFPTTLCTSINQEIVHGPARPARVLLLGDIISLDIGMEYPYTGVKSGLYTDMATTVAVGKISALARKLLKVTKESLFLGLAQIRPGQQIKDISLAIQQYVESQGFNVVRDLVGHGVGQKIHEEPSIPNFFQANHPEIKLKPGMTLAIEPMVVTGKYHTKTLADGWTTVALDGGLAAHYEHTIVVTNDGYEIITK
ncbi:MAG: type I methionyl aminopeptidase [Candidatus Buchananbacteria bacterium]